MGFQSDNGDFSNMAAFSADGINLNAHPTLLFLLPFVTRQNRPNFNISIQWFQSLETRT